jgi:hypothetical protein
MRFARWAGDQVLALPKGGLETAFVILCVFDCYRRTTVNHRLFASDDTDG